VVTWHLDRLNRSPMELERLIPLLEQRAVIVQTVTAGVLDIGTPSGRAVARTLGVSCPGPPGHPASEASFASAPRSWREPRDPTAASRRSPRPGHTSDGTLAAWRNT
jgi:hypothetical protein